MGYHGNDKYRKHGSVATLKSGGKLYLMRNKRRHLKKGEILLRRGKFNTSRVSLLEASDLREHHKPTRQTSVDQVVKIKLLFTSVRKTPAFRITCVASHRGNISFSLIMKMKVIQGSPRICIVFRK